MNVHKWIDDLKRQRALLDEAILAMESLATKGRARPNVEDVAKPRRRGRPPGSKNKTRTKALPSKSLVN
jgi:hypothetical protein